MGKASRKKKERTDSSAGGFETGNKGVGGPAAKTALLYSIILILAVSFAVYANALSNNFVHDDRSQVIQNPWIKDISHLKEIFTRDVWGFEEEDESSNYYRPMMHIGYMISYFTFGLKPWGFHLVNIMLHAGASVIAFLLLSKFLTETNRSTSSSYFKPALMAALLFASDPIHTEAVTWVAGFPDVSSTFFFLLSLYLYLRSRGDVNGNYLLSVVSFSFAAFSKEPAITLPIIIAAYDYIFRKEGYRFRSCLKKYVPYLVVTGGYIVLRSHALRSFVPSTTYVGLSTYQYVINIFPLFGHYLEKLLLPVNLSFWHSFHPIKSIFEAKGILSLTVTVVFVLLSYISYKRNKVVFFGLLLTVVPLLPALYIPAIVSKPFAERYLYLPSFGFMILLSSFLTWANAKIPKGTVSLTVASLAVIAFFSISTVSRNAVWRDDYSIFSDTIQKAPDSAEVRYNLGVVYASKGSLREAIELFQTAVRLNPYYAKAEYNLGIAYGLQGLKDEAIKHFQATLKLKPDFAKAEYGLGAVYASKGLVDEAIRHYQAALKLRPDFAKAEYGLGAVYGSKGLVDEAIGHYQAALRLKPDFAEAEYGIGVVYSSKGLVDEAIERFQTAVKLSPNFAEAYYNLGILYDRKGLASEAKKEFEVASRIKPYLGGIRRSRAVVTAN